MIKLPTWDECVTKLERGEPLNPVEDFVVRYDYNPKLMERFKEAVDYADSSARIVARDA